MILVAGVPGSGKTTLLRVLQGKLNSLYIRSDDIRDILNYEYHDNVLANNPGLKNEYIRYLFENKVVGFKNQAIIIDMSLDRNPDFCLDLAKDFQYPQFIISIDCNPDILKSRLNNREKEYREAFLNNLPKWIDDHNKFNEKAIADIYLDSGILPTDEMVEEVRDCLKI